MKHLEHTAYPIELIHGLHRDWGPTTFLFGIPRIHPSWLTPGPGSDTTCKDYGHHLSPHWYDIVHFGPKPSWICSWAIPKRPHTNGDICPSLYTHDPPHF